MASLTRDACEDRAAARPPLSRHPAFPKLVAAWFAGLFGAGCLILPGLLLERFVDATGLGAIAPVLAPPLSSAARAFLALAAAGLGGGLGALIAAHVARAHRAAPAGMPEPRASRQPISAHAELGAHGLTGAPRRSLLAEVLPEPLAAPSPDGRRDADEPLDLLVFADACLEPAAEAPVPVALLPRAVAMGPFGAPQCPPVPLESLGTAELVERLGAALQRRRERLSAAAPEETTQATGVYPREGPVHAPPARLPIPSSRGAPAYDSPADADAALRRAIATLQKMSAAG